MLRPFRAFESVETDSPCAWPRDRGFRIKDCESLFSDSQPVSALELELSVKFYSVGKFFQKQ